MAGAEVVGAALEEVVALVLAVELSPDFPSLLQAVRVPATATEARAIATNLRSNMIMSLSPYQHTVNVRSPRACGRMGWSACRFAGCCSHQGIINKGEQHPRQCDGKYETPHGG